MSYVENYIDSTYIKLINVETDDITDYYKTSLLLIFPHCANKCKNCQNIHLQKASTHYYAYQDIVELYNCQQSHLAVVCAGLEPFDSFEELYELVRCFMFNKKQVDFVIYTGYEESEISSQVKRLKRLLENCKYDKHEIIIKFGRYNEQYKKAWHSNFLGINLATFNQYVLRLSDGVYDVDLN